MPEMLKEIFEQPDILQHVCSKNSDILLGISREIKKRNIKYAVIAARGTSDHAAIFGKYLIESTCHIPVALAAPSVVTAYRADISYKEALVIGISQSGEAKDVLEIIKQANATGAFTIAITNFTDSPLAKSAFAHLHCAAGIETSVAATKTFTSELYLLALLGAYISGSPELYGLLLAVPDKLHTILTKKDEIFELAKRYRFMKECFTLSRGYNYCIAMESALKLQECAYVLAKAYSISDFMHGPLAMIENDTPCLVFLESGIFTDEMAGFINRIKKMGADITTFTNDSKLMDLSDRFVRMPDCHALESPFFFACAAQMFACAVSMEKGLNPDEPRNLKKVTITK